MCEAVENFAREYAEENMKEIAKKLLKKNLSIEDIVETTGLSTDEVENLLSSLDN